MEALTPADKLFLLAIDDDKGKVTSYVTEPLRYGLSGALLSELAFQGKIVLKNKRLEINDSLAPEDLLADEILARIAAEEHPHKIKHWVETLASRKLAPEIGIHLAERNILRIEEKLYVWVIPLEDHPEKNASAKYWIKQELREIILAEETPEPRSLVLLGLVKACRMLDLIFTRDERKAASKKVNALLKAENFDQAIREPMREILEAVSASAATAV